MGWREELTLFWNEVGLNYHFRPINSGKKVILANEDRRWRAEKYQNTVSSRFAHPPEVIPSGLADMACSVRIDAEMGPIPSTRC
jgi:hypothetical protein